MLGQPRPNFDANGNPVVDQFQSAPPQQMGPPQPAPQPVPAPLDPNVQAVMAQNRQLLQRLEQQNQQQAAPAPVAPPRPQNFNAHDIYDPETETGRWHIANQEFERNQMLGNVGTIIKEELGGIRQEQQFDNTLTTFANQTGMSPQQASEFKEFLDNPQADMNTLYEVFKTKQQITAPPPAPGQPPMQPQNIPTPQNVMRSQPPPIQQTGVNQLVQTPEMQEVARFEQQPPPPITSVGSPASGVQPSPTFAEMAKEQGFAR
jgi:hypothetical protein